MQVEESAAPGVEDSASHQATVAPQDEDGSDPILDVEGLASHQAMVVPTPPQLYEHMRPPLGERESGAQAEDLAQVAIYAAPDPSCGLSCQATAGCNKPCSRHVNHAGECDCGACDATRQVELPEIRGISPSLQIPATESEIAWDID